MDVLVMDKAMFPRDKTCAGWITPEVLEVLEIAPDQYANGRTLQRITAFRTSRMGDREVDTHYERPVSFGIRRCEFDHYLLERSGASFRGGTPVERIRRLPYRVSTLIPGRAIGVSTRLGPLAGVAEYRLVALDAGRTQLTMSSDYRGSGPCRILGGLLTRMARRDTEVVTANLKRVLEGSQT